MRTAASGTGQIVYLEDARETAHRGMDFDDLRRRIRIRHEQQTREAERWKIRRLLFVCTFLVLGAVTIYLYLESGPFH